MRILDIGCGRDGMAQRLARDHDARVLGVSLSEGQLAVATERGRAEGLADRAELRLIGYRKIEEQFDRIVSVGMFEHVGPPHYRTNFDAVRRLLTEDGVAPIHTIGTPGPPAATGPWIRKYTSPAAISPPCRNACTRSRARSLDHGC